MQKIIPFKKEILFKDRIEEIVSISMDHHLMRDEYNITGEFVVEGEYLNNSIKDKFRFELPYTGTLDKEYDVDKCSLDIDDFYYEIIEPNKLSIHIDILVDKLSEKPLIEEIPLLEEREDRKEIIEEKNNVEEENRDEIVVEQEEELEQASLEMEENVTAVTKVFGDKLEESYMTYRVYIVREGDTIPSILEKYQISEEHLRKYNVINELSLGDKLIIPHEKD